MKFLADCHLGKIAKYLRIFGFDTLYYQSIDDDDIITIAKKENRIVLTSDQGLYKRIPEITLYVEQDEFLNQLTFIFKELDLYHKIKPFTRCIDCNGKLKRVDKNTLIDDLKIKTKIFHDKFDQCSECKRVYWEGDHYKKMLQFIDEFLKNTMNTINIKLGDLTQENVCAIVNAANSSLMGGGGVDGAIHKAGGESILKECKKIRNINFPDGLPTGEAVVTTAGNLPCQYVIHTVGPIYSQYSETCKTHLSNCYVNSLVKAIELGCNSISFPAISTGIYGYPKDTAAKIAYSSVKEFLKEHKGLEVNFVFHSIKDKEIFEKAIA